MHHVPVTLGAAWWVGLVPGLGCAWWWCWTGLGAAWHWWVARRTASDLHVCDLIDILGVNRGCCGDFFLVVFGLVGGCFGGVQALCLVGCVSDRPPGAVAWPSVPGTYASRIAGARALHPGQGERPDRGPDHYRGSAQGETHPAEGATPTQDHGPEEALRSHPGRWRDAPGKTAWTTRPAPLHGALPPVPG